MINATFDVALEGPMQGIWFWCLIGFGIGSVMIYRCRLNFWWWVDDGEDSYRLVQSSDAIPRRLHPARRRPRLVDELVDIISGIAGKTVVKRHDTLRPQGVRGRNSDNSRLRSVLGWEPKTPLRVGLIPTYRWIEACMSGQLQQPVETAAE
jgi:hypothetical protein